MAHDKLSLVELIKSSIIIWCLLFLHVALTAAGSASLVKLPQAVDGTINTSRSQLQGCEPAECAQLAETGSERPTGRPYKLPSWFDHSLYKRFHNKHYREPEENDIHKRIYLRTALRVFEDRALFRANRMSSLSSINELSDMTTEQLRALKERRRASVYLTKPECCSYDQVYRRIIDLLSRTSAGPDKDLALSRALLDELEQRPLVETETHDEEPPGIRPNVSSLEPTRSGQPRTSLSNTNSSRPREGAVELVRPDNTLSQRERSEAGDNLAGALKVAVKKQILKQLNGNSPINQELTEQFSAYFGQPVAVKAELDGV